MKVKLLILILVILLCTMVVCTRKNEAEPQPTEITLPAETEEINKTTLITETSPLPSVREEEMSNEEPEVFEEEIVPSENQNAGSFHDTDASETERKPSEEPTSEDADEKLAPDNTEELEPFGNGENDTPDQEM